MLFSETLVQWLREGHLAVIPTDTLYGIVGVARSPEVVAELYRVRGRHPDKPCIILIDDIAALSYFGIALTAADTQALTKAWPGPVSVVFECPSPEYRYLHRGTQTLAFRIPADDELRTLLRNTGPLLAPSANPEGHPPARTIAEAQRYFSDATVLYVDDGYRESQPSTVARLRDGVFEILRQGKAVL